MGLRSTISWVRHGSRQTDARIAAYEAELRALQDKVEALTHVVARLDAAVVEGQRAASLLDAMKLQLRTITDDLGDRIGAVTERLDGPERG
jgi:exonuclease VII small subunit